MRIQRVLTACSALIITVSTFYAAHPGSARAQEPIKVGVVLDYSGMYADASHQLDNGVKLFLKKYGETIAGRKIQIITRDSQSQPAVAKRIVQELIVRDKVDFLTGIVATTSAFAMADLVTSAKVPTILMNAQGEGVPGKSPYFARVSVTVPQSAIAMADWATQNGIKEIYTLVADYQTGHDAEKAFITAYTAKGGKIIQSMRTPLATHDYSPFLQKVKDARPPALFVWVPVPDQLLRGMQEQGLRESGIKVLGTGELTDERRLTRTGDAALGIISTHHYSSTHKSVLNREFVKLYNEMFKAEAVPNPGYMAAAAYDAMRCIYSTVEQLKGNVDGAAAMKIIAGMKFESPRGPIVIDAATRDIVQNIYVRRVEPVDGRLANVEISEYPMVGDAWKNFPAK
jgi:branched-chain amino acid transport system substrate-binding protein